MMSYYRWSVVESYVHIVLTWQVFVELEHIRVFIPLTQVCSLVEIGHACKFWSISSLLSVFYIQVKLIVFCGNHQHASHHKHIPMTYSGHRPDRTIKAEEKWRGKSRKTTKRLIFPADDRRNVSKILPQSGSCLRTDLLIEPSSSCLKQRRRKSAGWSERRLKRGAFWTSYPATLFLPRFVTE